MNFPELHSHKWSRTFQRAKNHAEKAAAAFNQGLPESAREELNRMYHGDLEDEDNIFPGLKISGAYWRAVEGEMELRFQVLYEYSNWPNIIDLPEFQQDVERYYRLFLSDVQEIVTSQQLLDYSRLEPYTLNYETLKLGDQWVELYQNLCSQTEKAIETGKMPDDLLEEWFVYCLRAVIAYDYGLIRQAILAKIIIQQQGFESFVKLVAASADDFGWRVSRLFFTKIYPEAGIEGLMLRQLGRYGMFADQDLKTTEIRPPEDDEETPVLKYSEFLTCELAGIFMRVSEDSGIPLNKLGLGICVQCADHARKNTEIFVPPDQRPALRMIRALGLGDQSCWFETEIYPEPDMERFLNAQEQVFYSES